MPFIDDWICVDRQAVNPNTLICIVLAQQRQASFFAYFSIE